MMASENAPAEPITAEPVIVEKSDAQKVAGDTPKQEPAGEKKPKDVEEEEVDADIHVKGNRRSRRRSYTPSPRRYRPVREVEIRPPTDAVIVIKNSKGFNELVLEPTDAIVETVGGIFRESYVTSYAFHPEEIEKISWILTIGIQDAWVVRPVSYLATHGFQFELPLGGQRRQQDYMERFDGGRDDVTITRLGAAFRVFKDDMEESQTSKVKFVIVIQSRASPAWHRLILSYTRQTALAAIYHEFLNLHSVVFVGAVLQNATIPVGYPTQQGGVKFKKANSVQELEEMEKGVIGVIC
jgi:hypothetical protein